MLGTIITSSYADGSRRELYDAIEQICSIKDNYGWASSGIYCYWEPTTKIILYIGLAAELSLRFGQHNRVVSAPDAATKRVQIDGYFQSHQHLGHSIMVQSPLSQCVTANSPPEVVAGLERFIEESETPEQYELEELKQQSSEQGYEQITYMESLLLRTHERTRGRIPQWNKIHGMGYQHTEAHLRTAEKILAAMTDTGPNFLVAKSTIQTLAREPMSQHFEELLHTARINALWLGMDTTKAMESVHDELNYFKLMRERGYLERTPQI